MRFRIIYGAAAAVALAAPGARGQVVDSMCVVKDVNSGMLIETPCDVLSLHKQNVGDIGEQAGTVHGNIKVERSENSPQFESSDAHSIVQRDTPTTAENSAVSVLASMVAAPNLWPSGVRPFMAPTATASSAAHCVDSLAEEFAMNIVFASSTSAGSTTKRTVSNFGINLVNGTLIDSANRLGNIVANRQLQFDAFGQAGSVYTAGFQACGPSNERLLALGGSTVWWGCLSGTFMNLYDQNVAPQCVEVKLSLVNNFKPGAGLNDVNESASTFLSFRPVSITTTLSNDNPSPTVADKRATWSSPTNTWLHTMLLSSTPVSVWVPYPVFTTNGVVWSATQTKYDGTTATYLGGPIATAYVKRNEDGVGNDVPTFFQDMSTQVTLTFAAETYEMVFATGDSDVVETITVPPSTVTLDIASGTATATGAAKEKRQEAVIPSVIKTTTSIVYDPVSVITEHTQVTSVVSQPVATATEIVTLTTTAALSSTTVTQNATSVIVESSTSTLTSSPTHTRQTVWVDATSTTTIVTALSSDLASSNATTSFVTAEAATSYVTAGVVSVTGNGTVVTSTTTLAPTPSTATTAANGTVVTLSSTTFTSYNISTFTATGLTLNYDTSTALSLSTSTSHASTTTTRAIPSGTIGFGTDPAASTTKALSGASKGKNGPGCLPIISAALVGLAVMWYAEKYLGRLHV